MESSWGLGQCFTEIGKDGKKSEIIEASENNFKITTPADLALAKIIIKDIKK
jgi:2-C-methyl-D-erythritol 4-phosphate cytidylyltransferase